MIRLLVSDIDGTLVTKDKQLTDATKQAARRLKEHGIAVVLTSSRPPHGVALFADALELDTPRAAFNGGAIVSASGEVLLMRTIQQDATEEALRALEERGISPWLFTADEWLLQDADAHYVAWERRTVKMPFRVVEEFEPSVTRQAGKIMAASEDFAMLADCETALQKQLNGRAAVHRSQDYYLDITHSQANKGEAVREAARILNIPLEETACIGDMANDFPMFGVAGTSIAMGNAPEFMRAQADFVTKSNDQEGWAHAVNAFILRQSGEQD